jgi:hypothetical protein
MSIEHPTATDLWSARTAVSITVGHAHRVRADADRDLVEKLTRDVDAYRTENARLLAELRAMCEIVERVTAERDRARDLAVRAGAFDGCASCDQVTAEFGRLIEERDQALYERDAAMRLYELDRESVEFARGLIPTQQGDSDGR